MIITGPNIAMSQVAGEDSVHKTHSSTTFDTCSDTLPVPTPKHNELAPGSARIRAKITKLDKSSRGIILIFKIKQTEGYGAATPPLASGQLIKVDATGFYENKPDSVGWIETGKTTIATIRHLPKIEQGSSAPTWSLVECMNLQNPGN